MADDGILAKMRADVELISARIAAKWAILEEVLNTVECEDSTDASLKRRRQIKQVLSADLVTKAPTTSLVDVSVDTTSTFENFACVVVVIENRSPTFDMCPTFCTLPTSSVVRSTICDSEGGLVSRIVKSSGAKVYVAFPKQVFYARRRVTVVVDCGFVLPNSEIPSAVVELVCRNAPVVEESPHLPPPQTICVAVDTPTTSHRLDDLQHVAEKEALELRASLRTCCWRATLASNQLTVADFRRRFPLFVSCDFDSWQAFIGVQHYAGLVVLVDSGTKQEGVRQFYSMCKDQLRAFVQHLDDVPATDVGTMLTIGEQRSSGFEDAKQQVREVVEPAHDSFDDDFFD